MDRDLYILWFGLSVQLVLLHPFGALRPRLDSSRAGVVTYGWGFRASPGSCPSDGLAVWAG